MKSTTILLVVLLIAPAFALAGQAQSSPLHPSPFTLPPASPPAPAPRANATDYSDVLLLINNQSQLSMQVGNYFKQKRAVPDKNVCNISMPASEWINPSQFGTVRTAVENFITGAGLNSTLNYIVTTKGCPLGVWQDNNRYASFMDELGLILGPYSANIGNTYWMNNPFGGSEERFSRQNMGIFIVTRIDGYDLGDCLRLIDLASNATGSRGTFVLDSQPWKDGSGYQSGNDWCRAANRTLTEKGWKVYLDDTSWYVVNQKNVSGYCSWGSNDGNASNYAKPGFTWVPGALGSTYVSTSARSFAYPPSYGQSLIADLVREGITGVHGNVAEPYLDACSRPQYFLERWTRGWNLGESFYAGMATQSWQNCVIGDPKIEAYADQPDPAVFGPDISFSEPALVQGMNINITAKVRNLGGGAAQGTVASFWNGEPGRGGTQIGENQTIDLIPAGGYREITTPWDLSNVSGGPLVHVWLTPSNITPQLWKGNDLAFRNSTVFSRPDLAVPRDRLSVSHLSPLEGDPVWVNATVRNNGGFVASSPLRFWLDDELLAEVDVSLLGGEEARHGIVIDTRGRPGAHRITVDVPPVPYELPITNNNASVSLFVRQFDLSLSSESAMLECLPGRTAVFNVTVRSLSNTAEAVALGLAPAPDYWSGSVEPGRLELEPGAAGNATVTVFAPELGLSGDRWDLRFRAEGLTGGVLRELELSVGVLPVRLLQLSCDPAEGSALPMENASFRLVLRNLGNGPDTAALSARAPEGWNVTFENASLPLAHKGSGSVLFHVLPPISAPAGERRQVVVEAASAGGLSWNTSVTVEVEQRYESFSYADATLLVIPAGGEGMTVIHLENQGNGEEAFRLSVQGGDLQASLSAQTVTLGAFSAQNITLEVKVPEKFAGSGAGVEIVVQPARSPRMVLPVAVNVTRPDLVIPGQAVKVAPASPVEGAQATVTVEVRNAGAAASGPVTVRLQEFGQTVGNFTIDDLAPGGSATVVFTWTAGAPGVHELRISAECRFRDPTIEDNSAGATVTVAARKVAGPPAGDGSGPSTVVIAGGLLLVVAAAMAVAFIFLRRRPPAQAAPAPRTGADRAGFSLVSGGGEEGPRGR
jgi:uncharacterized protein (TIGR03790 family)